MRHAVNVELAVQYGFNNSIFLTNSYKIFKKKIVIDENQLLVIFPYFSKPQLEEILNELMALNIISSTSESEENFYYLTKKGNLLMKGI